MSDRCYGYIHILRGLDMTTIYLIRHAEAEGNLYRIAQGTEDGKVTKRGWDQIRALSRRFESIHISAVYSSDSYRTCATASAIYLTKNLPLRVDPTLREAHLGEWEGKPWGEISRKNPEQLVNFSIRTHLWRVRGGETAAEVQNRLFNAVCRIGKQHDGETIAIVSHGFAIRMLLGKLQGYPLERIGETPQEDNTAVSMLELDGDELRVVFRSDNSHLFDFANAGKKIARKRASALEDGMYYRLPAIPKETELLLNMSAAACGEANGSSLHNNSSDLYSLFGCNGTNEPSALLQMGDPGWISTLYVRPEERKQGLGVQLIGQAVQRTLEQGETKLRVRLRKENPAWALFADNSFITVTEDTDGQIVLEKDLNCEINF